EVALAGPEPDGPGTADADADADAADAAAPGADADAAGSASQETANPARTTAATAVPRTVEPNTCHPRDR
ncbi:hypothetical protein, partial [Streptomyces yangpuensis]|uniref:hypothetical protein n=1 Tax=Streptomyces yangpuensis TaxID=1648182 RepID=UPI003699B4B4